MRVTKTVKDYIRKKVIEKYIPRLDEIDFEYKSEKAKVNKKIEDAVEKFEKELRAIVANNCENYNFTPKRYSNDERPILSWYEVADREAEKEYYQMKRILEAEIEEKIENIIVELELGGDRKMLEEMLNKI